MILGKLKKVDLREQWKHEAIDFTKWLALPENIELLGDEIGIGIQVKQTEANVGRFNVDIYVEEENTGRKIIIENQLESTNHAHLGQIITYAAGLDVEFIVWSVREIKEEHIQAIDWLNEHTDEHINFFLLKIELWQIGDSVPAPKFSVICRPNEWKRSVRTSVQEGDLTDTKIKQLEFWQQFKEFGSSKFPQIKLRTPRPQHWYDVSIGRSDCHVCFIVDSRENMVRCELYIPDSKELCSKFLMNKGPIEKELAFEESIEWQELPEKKASRIRIVHDFKFSDTTTWNGAFAWLANSFNKLKMTFSKEW